MQATDETTVPLTYTDHALLWLADHEMKQILGHASWIQLSTLLVLLFFLLQMWDGNAV